MHDAQGHYGFVLTGSGTVEALTFQRCFLVSFLYEHVPGALREERQQQELDDGGDPSQTQHKSPAWTQTVHL